jgi:hypothetical protein
MAVRVLLSATLRKYLPAYNPAEGIALDVRAGTTIEEVCQGMKIPVEHIKIVMVDGKRESLNYVLRGEERIGLFPPIGGG